MVEQKVSQSVLNSVSTDVNQSVGLFEEDACGPFFFYPFCSRCRLRERAVRLSRLAGEQVGTGRDIRPVFGGGRNIICFAPGKLCFPLREIDFVTENSLPARGWETPPKSSFFTGHPMCRDRILTAEGCPAPFVQKWEPWKA